MAAPDKKDIISVLITAVASVIVAWITTRGVASAQAKQAIEQKGGQVAQIQNSVDNAQKQLDLARSTSGIPPGTIVAFHPSNGTIPTGWAICNGTQGTPDLRGRFLRGTGDVANAGATGGTEKHGHHSTVRLPLGPSKGSDFHWGETPWAGAPNPAPGGMELPVSVDPEPNLPPYYDAVYIMKL